MLLCHASFSTVNCVDCFDLIPRLLVRVRRPTGGGEQTAPPPMGPTDVPVAVPPGAGLGPLPSRRSAPSGVTPFLQLLREALSARGGLAFLPPPFSCGVRHPAPNSIEGSSKKGGGVVLLCV